MNKKSQNSILGTSLSLQESPFFIMGVVHRHFRNDANRQLVEQHDISTEMLKALEVIHHHNVTTQQKLADITMNERSATKRLVDNLIKRGLVDIKRDDQNLKHKLLSLTALGIEVKHSGSKMVQTLEKRWLTKLESSDVNTLKAICHKLAEQNI